MGGLVPDRDVTAERVAQNDARFRDSNEKIRATAESVGMPRIPFLCECADLSCVEIMRLAPAEYEAVRASGRRFLVTPGHEAAEQGWARVVVRRDDYVVVEKIGESAEVAEKLNPRQDGVSE